MTTKATKAHRTTATRGRAPLELQIELIPKSLWEKNLRLHDGLGKWRWDKLRRRLIEKNGARCTICGATDRALNGHEVWDYREKKTVGTAVLLRVEIICVDCHDIHHWGRTTQLFQAGTIPAERYGHLRKHFCKVNRCTQDVLDRHALLSARTWLLRSKKSWTVDWGEFAAAVADAKAAREAWAARNPDHGDDFTVTPGHHVSNRCPECGAVGMLVQTEADRSEMSEGEEFEYDAGLWSFAFCRACQAQVFLQ